MSYCNTTRDTGLFQRKELTIPRRTFYTPHHSHAITPCEGLAIRHPYWFSKTTYPSGRLYGTTQSTSTSTSRVVILYGTSTPWVPSWHTPDRSSLAATLPFPQQGVHMHGSSIRACQRNFSRRHSYVGCTREWTRGATAVFHHSCRVQRTMSFRPCAKRWCTFAQSQTNLTCIHRTRVYG